MNWLEAVAAMKEGKKVRRKEWENRRLHCRGYQILWTHNRTFHGRIVDYEATDWEVVPEPPKKKKVTYYKVYYKLGRNSAIIYETNWGTEPNELIDEINITIITIEEREFEVPCD